MQYLITSDRLLLAYLHSGGDGKAADRLRIRGLKDATYGNVDTGWAFNALWGSDPGPLPRP